MSEYDYDYYPENEEEEEEEDEEDYKDEYESYYMRYHPQWVRDLVQEEREYAPNLHGSRGMDTIDDALSRSITRQWSSARERANYDWDYSLLQKWIDENIPPQDWLLDIIIG